MGWVGQGRWGVLEEERKGSGKVKRKRGEGVVSREGKACD